MIGLLGRHDSRPPRRISARRLLSCSLAAAAVFGALAVSDAGDDRVAEAATDDIIAFVVEGTGHGHGRGMSQWGAYGYAVDHGWTSGQILDHYFGGTETGSTAAGQRIAVRLTDYDGQGTVGVISHGSGVRWNGQTAPAMQANETSPGVFDILSASAVSCPSSTSLTVPDGPITKNASTYQADAEPVQRFLKNFHNGVIVVDGYFGNQTESVLASWQAAVGLAVDGTTWNLDDAIAARSIIDAAGGSVTWAKIGTHTQTPGNPVRFTSADGDDPSTDRGAVLGVCDSGGAVNHYRGALDVVHTASGNRVSNDVSAEAYLRGVVPKEISASWAAAGDGAGANAVQAQAVAARSYGLQQNRSYTFDGSDVRYATTCDTTSCQVYAGSATRASATGSVTRVEQDATDAAIGATANLVRIWPTGHPLEGQLVSTEFSASNGPRTAGGAFPPVDDIGDDTDPNPSHRWTLVFDAADFAAKNGLGTITSVATESTTDSRYSGFDGIWFDDVVITGTTGTFRQQAWDFRNAYDLKSPGFTLRPITRDTTDKTFAMIGDSVGNSIAGTETSELRRITNGTFPTARFDVVDSRCTTKTVCKGTSGVEAVADLDPDLDLVVVELGYNDTPKNFATDVDAMMTALTARGVKQVAWVNMADIRIEDGSLFYTQSNAALTAATTRWSNLTVLDWESASKTGERPRWFSDGVHLTTTGQAEFALWLRTQIGQLAPPVPGLPTPGPTPAPTDPPAPSHYLQPPNRIELPVAGLALASPSGAALVIPDNATGVALNVAVVGASARGFGTVWPCQEQRPTVASVNFERGDVLSNGVIAPISAAGTICLYSSVGTDIVVDVAGWFTGAASAAGSPAAQPDPFVGLLPDRRVDTRSGIGAAQEKVTAATPLNIPIAGTSATRPDGTSVTIPSDVAAAAINIAVVGPDRKGYVTAWPCGTARPLAANVNFERGAIVSNGVVAPVGGDGSVCIHVEATADVVVDLNGYFDGSTIVSTSGSNGADTTSDRAFSPVTPTRLIDTRTVGASSTAGKPIDPAAPLSIAVRGASLVDQTAPGSTIEVPASASAVALNLAIVNPTQNGYATVWPCSAPMPTTANVNFRKGTNVSNGVVAPIGDGGSICVFVSAPAHAVVDVAGWFRGGSDASFVGAVPQRVVDTRTALGPLPT